MEDLSKVLTDLAAALPLSCPSPGRIAVAPLVAWLLVLLTVGLAAMFGRQQFHTLRALPARPDLSPEDRSYFRRQAWRRLAGCGLMVAIAVMMSVWYVNRVGRRHRRPWRRLRRTRAAGDRGFTPEQDAARRFFVFYVIGMLLLLLALLLLTAIDLFAIRRLRGPAFCADPRRSAGDAGTRTRGAARASAAGQRGDPSDN